MSVKSDYNYVVYLFIVCLKFLILSWFNRNALLHRSLGYLLLLDCLCDSIAYVVVDVDVELDQSACDVEGDECASKAE